MKIYILFCNVSMITGSDSPEAKYVFCIFFKREKRIVFLMIENKTLTVVKNSQKLTTAGHKVGKALPPQCWTICPHIMKSCG